MTKSNFSFLAIIFAAILALVGSATSSKADEPKVDFNRDIRPILSGTCFVCHGPDAGTRESGLRLDTQAGVFAENDSGEPAIVAGKPDKSELIARLISDDEDYRMPPSDSGKPLTKEQLKLLKQWIAEGAKFQSHWSFEKPVRPALPKLKDAEGPKSAIDHFVISRLEKEQLRLSPQAEKYILCRRVYLDLTGIPPTIEQADAFYNDNSPNAFENLVDRLLSSPKFGERWARVWLDLARYADSQGYAQDSPRTIYRYRDWVIQAINENKPFDQFTIEQIAGDLLPNPTQDQLIATGFHRNTMTNSEGGTDNEEFRNAAVVDRTNTTMQVWMGITMGCAQCHTHKYDPITQEEYFKFFAILNQTEDADRPNESPFVSEYTIAQLMRQANLKKQIAALEKKIEIANAEAKKQDSKNAKPLVKAGKLETRFVRVQAIGARKFLHLAEVEVFAADKNVAVKKKSRQSSTAFGGPAKFANDGNTDGEFAKKSTNHTAQEKDPWWEVDLGDSKSVNKVTVWNRKDGVGNRLNHWRVILMDKSRKPIWIATLNTTPNPKQDFKIPADTKDFDKQTRAQLVAFLKSAGAGLSPDQLKLKQLRDQLARIKPSVTTPIMRELDPSKQRKTFIHVRGNFRVRGKEVSPGFVSAWHKSSNVEKPNRMDLAKWLVDAENPLTARVIVNRYWEQLFGTGIVETSEDFGTQGEFPSHPKLLDHLAVEFQRRQWDTKWLLKEIVTSATYRQTSRVSPDLVQRDPRNRLLARGPRYRLSAEMIRDQALFIAGMLSTKMNGPSVRPLRPKLGLRAAFGGTTDWEPSPGEDRYRRGLYTTWRRTSPYPSMVTFDAPSREFCTIRRSRTNTPLQALVTLNDPVYVEAARELARQTIKVSQDAPARMVLAFRKTLTRFPTDKELEVLERTYKKVLARFNENPESAKQILTSTQMKSKKQTNDQTIAELAAWTVMGNVLLNLDETIARP